MQLGGFSATNFRELSKGVTAPQKDRDLLRAYLQRRPAVKRREGPGGFFDNHRDVGDQAEIAGCPQGRSCGTAGEARRLCLFSDSATATDVTASRSRLGSARRLFVGLSCYAGCP